ARGVRLKTAAGQPLVMDLQMIVPVAFDWDRDGDADLIVGDEDGRVALIENVTSRAGRPTTPAFLAPRFFQQKAETLKCGALATPVGVDWDGDGDTDILSGNTAGTIEFFENLGEAPAINGFPKWAAPVAVQVDGQPFRIMAGPNLSIQGPAEAKWGYTTFSVADWDHDGRLDIVFNSIIGQVQWLKNEGTRTEPKISAPQPVDVEWPADHQMPRRPKWTWWQPSGQELVTQWRTTPVVIDLTGDQLVDLVMLDTEGYLALFQRERRGEKLVLLPPQRVLHDELGRPLRFNDRSAGGSGRRKLSFVDWDRDGQLDILLNSSNADLYRGLGRTDGAWRFQKAGTLAGQNIEGHDVSPTTVDFDRNGTPDFLGGAEDGRFYYLKNPN
ncbi:MAG: VCBS repeat-containing protein, partial [Pirellulaceae bacterium]|nr:VCBS repeat-containing protein [Pirellulaceae bacterium]